ncbi:MAG TPA: methionyl-tRNA formyltransferase [Candidatus Paceibacterota bacterium]|nr:methionyl-tRNA formyltransferase [Candidatus Paceibacterota bacterium]
MSRKCKFLFFGTPYVARDTLAMLMDAGYVPEAVVTSPDAPRGRGLALAPSETAAWADERGLRVLKPETLTSGVIEELQAYGAEYAIVVAYGKILPRKLIDAFPKGVLNIHYSLLPKYRGASPVERALLDGETVTGVTVQRMVFKLDAGDVLAAREEAILPDDTTRTLRARLIPLGARLLVDTLPAFEDGILSGTPQDEGAATFSGKIDKKDGELALPGNDQENWSKYRAYAESPGTYFFAERGGKTVRVKIVTAAFENGRFIPVRVVPEGKKEMAYADFVRA